MIIERDKSVLDLDRCYFNASEKDPYFQILSGSLSAADLQSGLTISNEKEINKQWIELVLWKFAAAENKSEAIKTCKNSLLLIISNACKFSDNKTNREFFKIYPDLITTMKKSTIRGGRLISEFLQPYESLQIFNDKIAFSLVNDTTKLFLSIEERLFNLIYDSIYAATFDACQRTARLTDTNLWISSYEDQQQKMTAIWHLIVERSADYCQLAVNRKTDEILRLQVLVRKFRHIIHLSDRLSSRIDHTRESQEKLNALNMLSKELDGMV